VHLFQPLFDLLQIFTFQWVLSEYEYAQQGGGNRYETAQRTDSKDRAHWLLIYRQIRIVSSLGQNQPHDQRVQRYSKSYDQRVRTEVHAFSPSTCFDLVFVGYFGDHDVQNDERSCKADRKTASQYQSLDESFDECKPAEKDRPEDH